ncbi:MAG: LysM peptidoglycan-binding domain-containing protein [Bacteroidales bacterium]|nr:LysM peptidoglycan-binding domain-containing protein [Bacteroidales bacterium]
MKRKGLLRNISLALTAAMMCFSASALDLPIKKVKGQQFYVYEVRKGDSVFGVSKKLGITTEEIIKHNASAVNGIKKGMKLYFPVEEYTQPAEPVEEEVVVVEDTVEVVVNPAVAIILPFGLDNSEQTRQNKLALDFYRGFLIAADSLSNRPGQLDINVYDCGSNVDELKRLLSTNPDLGKSQVIVGPEDEAMLEVIEDFATTTRTYVLNVLNVRDSAYISNPYVLQANIPQKDMYTLAIKAFMDLYEGYKPVILRNDKGRNEKEPFVEALSEELASRGIEPIRINYAGTLLVADLDVMERHGAGKYVIIPSSGALSEFNKFAHVVKALRDKAADMPLTDDDAVLTEIALFGYPDWTAFRGDALELLQKLNARVYSRFYDNFLGFDSRIIADDFRFWYGTDMIESIPSQGLLGYDTANYIIRNIRANENAFNPDWKLYTPGIQSVFRFERHTDGGFYNNALYIVEFLPEGRMTKRIVY